MAMQYGQKAKEIRKVYEKNDMVPELIAQIRKSKSLDWLMHHVEFVDPAGASIDRDELLGHTHDDHDAAADGDATDGDAADGDAADDDVAAQASTPDSPTDNEENDES
jgi:hypothetical protein